MDVRQAGIEFLELKGVIQNTQVLDFTLEALSAYTKEEFFYIPASNSGKYHPGYALGIGGLLRHTKSCLLLAVELFTIHKFKPEVQDYILSALALHDIEKPSKTHPIEVKLRLEALRDLKTFCKVIPLIESHMGQFDMYGKLPRPKTRAQKYVHLVDYLASRNFIEVNFLSRV